MCMSRGTAAVGRNSGVEWCYICPFMEDGGVDLILPLVLERLAPAERRRSATAVHISYSLIWSSGSSGSASRDDAHQLPSILNLHIETLEDCDSYYSIIIECRISYISSSIHSPLSVVFIVATESIG